LIIDELELNGITGPAQHTGKSQIDKGELNPYYLNKAMEYGVKQINSTPKTDFISNGGSERISLKIGKAKLFEHMIADSRICFDYVFDHSRLSKAIKAKLSKTLLQMQSEVQELVKGFAAKHSKVQVRSISDKVIDGLLDDIQGIINDRRFKLEFVKMGCSGEFKFGDSVGTETKLVKVKAKKDVNTLQLLKDSTLFRGIEVMDFTETSSEWEAMLRGYKPVFTVVRKDIEFSLREGLMDVIGKGFRVVIDFFVGLFKKLWGYLREGVSVFMRKLGIEPQIQFDNEGY
jgi:hypothetical protein